MSYIILFFQVLHSLPLVPVQVVLDLSSSYCRVGGPATDLKQYCQTNKRAICLQMDSKFVRAAAVKPATRSRRNVLPLYPRSHGSTGHRLLTGPDEASLYSRICLICISFLYELITGPTMTLTISQQVLSPDISTEAAAATAKSRMTQVPSLTSGPQESIAYYALR